MMIAENGDSGYFADFTKGASGDGHACGIKQMTTYQSGLTNFLHRMLEGVGSLFGIGAIGSTALSIFGGASTQNGSDH